MWECRQFRTIPLCLFFLFMLSTFFFIFFFFLFLFLFFFIFPFFFFWFYLFIYLFIFFSLFFPLQWRSSPQGTVLQDKPSWVWVPHRCITLEVKFLGHRLHSRLRFQSIFTNNFIGTSKILDQLYFQINPFFDALDFILLFFGFFSFSLLSFLGSLLQPLQKRYRPEDNYFHSAYCDRW